jgi:uncharacterized sulfatase
MHLSRQILGTPLLFAMAIVQLGCFTCAANDDPPNIVFMLVDDLAWSDLGCYGNKIHETPHIDRLASQGMRFTQAYAPAPICSASRAAIMTGKFPARLQFEFVTKASAGQQQLPVPLQSPPFTLNLPLGEQTMAEVLAGCGYATGFFGKWHLNQHYQGYLGWSPTHGPLQQGFASGDSDFGAHPYSYRASKLRDQPLPPGSFPTDRLTEKATDFIHAHRDQPFLLYLSHYFVHDPVHSRCQWLVDKYRRRIGAGGPTSRAAYGAMVETMDHLVGQLLQALQEDQLADRTLVVLMSDNGGHPNHTTNAPLRGSKWNLYEGGIRVPLIVSWPGQVPAASTCHEVVHGCDWLPTFAAIAKSAESPESIDGVSLLPLLRDPATSLDRRSPLIWHFPYYHPEKNFAACPREIGVGDFVTSQTRPHSAIRQGDWKLLHFYEADRVELYHLSADIAESADVAAEQPQRTRELKSQLTGTLNHLEARLPTQRPAGR